MQPIYLRGEFNATHRSGAEYSVTVELKTVAEKPRPMIEFYFSFRNTNFGNGGRREWHEATDTIIATASAALVGKMPREIFADALEEFGIDCGITECVRGEMRY